MKVTKIKTRNILVTGSPDPSWDLNVHLIIGNKHNFLIDTGLGSDYTQAIKPYLNDNPLIIINTHYHWDHVWANGDLESIAIIAHNLCLKKMEETFDEILEKNSKYKAGEVSKKFPTLVFEDRIYFPEDKVLIFYTPGHTEDSISILDLEDKVLNAGDNIGDSLDYIVPGIYCDKKYLPITLDNYLKLDFDTLISGHNQVLDKTIIATIKSKLSQE